MRAVRVLLAPDAFAGALSAVQAADAMAVGWARRSPDDVLVRRPLSNGGPGFVDVVLAARGGALGDLPDAALARLPDVRAGLAGVELVLASDTDLPLTGFSGASATEAAGRGASPEQAQALEAALGRLADVAQRSLVAGRPLA